MKLELLKNQPQFYCPTFNNDECLSYNICINKLKKDIKIIKKLIETQTFDITGISNINFSIYTILIDNNLEEAILSTKKQLNHYLNKRFYLKRASRFLNLTGNFYTDRASICLLEECRKLLVEEKATIEEIKQILPINHKLNIGENK